MVSETDPNGGVTTYEYDDLGRQIKTILPDPDGAGSQLSPEFVSTYDALGRRTQLSAEIDSTNDESYT